MTPKRIIPVVALVLSPELFALTESRQELTERLRKHAHTTSFLALAAAG